MDRELSSVEQDALDYFNLDYAESSEEDAGWFCYTDIENIRHDYRGSSCECLENVVQWYEARPQESWIDE